jgi:SpoIIAA-like
LIGTRNEPDRASFILLRAGVQPKLDIVAIAAELADTIGSSTPRVLFEWSQISSWPFRSPTMAAIQAWYKTAPAISRVAFVHDRRWNMHVAILSALIRVSKGQVRSFRPADYDLAVAWLQQEDAIVSSRDDDLRVCPRTSRLNA